ncbi:MAG: hypothetical protein MUD17_01925 [Gemmatimonadaceae bacterium]|jgi:hypothetical protein|nr:hypothetical protein [Gemmatimonadaceae bacterium]
MPFQNPRSLKYEYELYVEREIEDYKDSIPRSAILKIGDEAVASLARQPQVALTELLIWQEVDRIISRRLRLPTYQTWRRRRLRELEKYRRPETWGLDPNAAVCRAVEHAPDRHVLIAGTTDEAPALYLAANGCAVTALDPAADLMQRVLAAAQQAGLHDRVRTYHGDLAAWHPDVELHAVVCGATALARLSPADRARVIDVLQSATADGGVHLVETIAAGAQDVGSDGTPTIVMSLEELESRYRGWNVSLERTRENGSRTFLARKEAVA